MIYMIRLFDEWEVDSRLRGNDSYTNSTLEMSFPHVSPSLSFPHVSSGNPRSLRERQHSRICVPFVDGKMEQLAAIAVLAEYLGSEYTLALKGNIY